ncbi:MAG: excinuclease ABC subunit UvrA, partial [Schleiferiaceae bacterium]|nr:excinuclease ABC subunit UvrA [Schleiferiaceae bacterium]
PLVKSRKGHYRELFEQIAKQGFVSARVDGQLVEISRGMRLDRYKTHDIEVSVDRFTVTPEVRARMQESIKTALQFGNGVLMIYDMEAKTVRYFSKNLMCPSTGIAYPLPEPNAFSFNSPKGACPTCNGLGKIQQVALDKIIPDPTISIKKGGLKPLGEFKKTWIFSQLEILGDFYGFTLNTPIKDIPEAALAIILHGAAQTLEVENKTLGITRKFSSAFEGIIAFIETQSQEVKSKTMQRWAGDFMNEVTCPSCEGSRLRQESRYYKIAEKSIADVVHFSLDELNNWFDTLPQQLSEKQNRIATEILKELKARTQFLLDVGLSYLSLNRSSKTLSGGEAQRIRLATQIGSQLVGVLYILDEPSIGLHQRDNQKLIDSLKSLRDVGNSVLVVEHDKDMIEAADVVYDVGPGAGKFGGQIVAQGTLQDILNSNSLTAQYLNGTRKIAVPETRRPGNGLFLELKGASGHNLKDVNIKLPLGCMVVVSGVSGSGKSSLINETLYRILNKHFYNAVKEPLPYKTIKGLEHLDKVIDINQSPIGRTPRSNPATYTGVLSDIRDLFANLPEAKIRGYKPGRFSFNVKGGRCETCQGAGLRVIEMNFLPDVYVPCETCQGKRFNRETLEIRYRGKSISDVLEMSVSEAVKFFDKIPKVLQKIRTIEDVGLGYITLGQQSTTLSGGEAQRVKLATELSKRDTGNTLYILDEPTTGLHFEDIRVLMDVLQKLVDRGNSVLIIEHNLDVIKLADYLIDIGPEGGNGGGTVVAQGTPEKVVRSKKSLTAQFLKSELGL